MAGFIEMIARWTRSPAFKFSLIAFLILLLLIPLLIVNGLVFERQSRAQEVRSEVGRIWGPEQRLQGPFLVVPYTVRVEVMQGEKRIEQIQERKAIFTPETLDITAATDSKTLRRSIFEVPVYTTKLKLTGRFATPRIADVTAEAASVRWRDASVVLALSGVSGLKEAAILKIPGAADTAFAPSVGIPGLTTTGMHAKIVNAGPTVLPDPEKESAPFNFSVDLTFNGSVSLDFAPVARETRVTLTSNWPHPSFAGAFLPDDRQISANGFKASWKIPHLARSVPESWNLADAGVERLSQYAFGVRMIEPVDFYAMVNRATKYGLMFLTLAFMAVFCLELVSRNSVHPVQYLFTGIALIFFYVLLLSLAEHIGFARAYALAATATTIMLAGYIGAVFASRKLGLIMLAVFSVTYLLLYFILQLEDYALLAGALLGFTALTIVMFATLRVDWSGRSQLPAPASA